MDLAVSTLIGLGVLALAADVVRTRRERGTSREWGAVAAIALGALGLRLLFIGQSSLDHLEATYLFEAVKPRTLFGVLQSRQAAEQMHQPLYDLLLRGVASLSHDEGVLRSPSAVLSAACVPVVWALLRDGLGRTEALLGAAMTAVAPLLVWYGRDATPYALFALVSLAAVASAAQAIANAARWPSVRAGLLLGLAFYAHFHGAWVAVTVGAWVLWERRGAVLPMVAATSLLVLPGLAGLLLKLGDSVGGLREDEPVMRWSHAWTEALSEAFRVLLGGPTPVWAATLALAVWGTVRLVRRRSPLGSLTIVTAVVAVVAEAHIVWQLSRSKGIVYIDVRHYLWLGPILLAPVLVLPRHVAAAAVIGLELWTSVPMVTTLEKPDVRSALSWVKKYAKKDHGVAFLPAPWYQPIVELYLFDVCPDLVHARGMDGWWRYDGCAFTEVPVDNSVYGFPWTPERIWQSTRRLNLHYLWVLDIRDHRFGLPVPPTEPEGRFRCWTGLEAARVGVEKHFGDWVSVGLYDVSKLRTAAPPPPADPTIRTGTSAEAWERACGK